MSECLDYQIGIEFARYLFEHASEWSGSESQITLNNLKIGDIIMNAMISRHLNRNNQNNWLPSVFDDFFDDDWMKQANATAPAINVKESKSDYTIEVAAPGMTKEDFNVSIDEDNDLVISMEKKNEKKEGNEDTLYLRREFSYTKFQQAMLLPDDVDKEKIDAKVENGVLYLTLPKLAVEAQKSPKRLISVK